MNWLGYPMVTCSGAALVDELAVAGGQQLRRRGDRAGVDEAVLLVHAGECSSWATRA
jgi:hypothetical protein